MVFNFRLFSAVATKAYRQLESPAYTLEEALSVFSCYFEWYEETFGEAHPHIKAEQIAVMIGKMPVFEDESGGGIDITPDDYFCLIERHFQTDYEGCDYNINHFFSGDIRLHRYYESAY